MFLLTTGGTPINNRNVAPHKLHAWETNPEGKYQCRVCGLVAGTVTTENGDY